MPTYEYACTKCGQHLEVVQSFTEDSLTECPNCGGPLRKVFGNIGIVLKGSGFYKTDSRSSGGAKKSRSDSTDSSAGSSSDSGSQSSSDSSSSSSPSGSGSSGDSGTSKTADSGSGKSGKSGKGAESTKKAKAAGAT